MGCVQWQRSAGFEPDIGVDRIGERLHGRTEPPGLADHYTNAFAFGFEDREVGFVVMASQTYLKFPNQTAWVSLSVG